MVRLGNACRTGSLTKWLTPWACPVVNQALLVFLLRNYRSSPTKCQGLKFVVHLLLWAELPKAGLLLSSPLLSCFVLTCLVGGVVRESLSTTVGGV